MPYFASLPEQRLKLLLEILKVEPVPSGTVLCREGEPGDCMYIIVSGSVQVFGPPKFLRGSTCIAASLPAEEPAQAAALPPARASSASVHRKTTTGHLGHAAIGRLQRVIAKGFLVKRGGRIKTWRRRYCVLRGNVLSYYDSKSEQAMFLVPTHDVQADARGSVSPQASLRLLSLTDGDAAGASCSSGPDAQAGEGSLPALRPSRSVRLYSSTASASGQTAPVQPRGSKLLSQVSPPRSMNMLLSKEKRRTMAVSLIGQHRAKGPRKLKGRFALRGASVWQGRPGGFILHTCSGRDVYCEASTPDERSDWLRSINIGILRAQSEALVKHALLDWDSDDESSGLDAPPARACEAARPGPQAEGSARKRPGTLGKAPLSALPETVRLPQQQRRKRALGSQPAAPVEVEVAGLQDGVGEVVEEGDSEDEGNAQVLVTELYAGAFFGEASLITRSPRNATVVAGGRSVLLRLSRSHFRNFLRIMPDVQLAIDQAVKRRYAMRLASLKLPFLAGFDEERLMALADKGRLVTFRHGDIVFSQGQLGSSFYIILNGSAAVVLQASKEAPRRVVALLRAGEYFGELALLQSAPRAASIVVREATTLLELDRDSFVGLFMEASSSGRSVAVPVVSSPAARRNTVDQGSGVLPPRSSQQLSTDHCLADAIIVSATGGAQGLQLQAGQSGYYDASQLSGTVLLGGSGGQDGQGFADFELRLFKDKAELRHVLHHALGLQHFRDALKAEFSAENVQFWSQVQLFRSRWLPVAESLPMCVQRALLAEHAAARQSKGPSKPASRRQASSAALTTQLPADAGSPEFDVPSSTAAVEGVVDDADVSTFTSAVWRVVQDAEELHGMFIVDTAAAQINIPSSVRSLIDRHMASLVAWATAAGDHIHGLSRQEAPSVVQAITSRGSAAPAAQVAATEYLRLARRFVEALTVFDEAQAEIYELMNKDNFSRFKAGPHFKALLDAVSPYVTQADSP